MLEREALLFLGKTLLSAVLIAGLSSLATRHPVLAGYLMALPVSTVLALSFLYAQTGNGAQATTFGLSILTALPVTLLFFVPFLFYSRLKGSFWLYMLAGMALLVLGHFIHRSLSARFLTGA